MKFQVRAGGEVCVADKSQNLGGIPGNKGALETKVKAFPKRRKKDVFQKKKKKAKESWSNSIHGILISLVMQA